MISCVDCFYTTHDADGADCLEQEQQAGRAQESRRAGEVETRARNSRVLSRMTSVDHGVDAPKRRVELEWRPGGVQRE
jgi:hypothetical protein